MFLLISFIPDLILEGFNIFGVLYVCFATAGRVSRLSGKKLQVALEETAYRN
jgi:hypothetical protein